MRCDQCKHWKPIDEWEALSAGFRQCMAVRERWEIQDEASSGIEWSYDENGEYIKRRKDALAAAKACVQDGSEYRADLLTGPDFFCALFDADSAIAKLRRE
jgi:hypothetical protein